MKSVAFKTSRLAKINDRCHSDDTKVCSSLRGFDLLCSDQIGKAFFPPELVMQNQQAIALTEAQRNSISKEMQNAQSEFMNLQWELEKESEMFKTLIQKEKPSEADVLGQLDRMLSIENKIKKRQIGLLIRIKNLLSHEQQETLQKIKR